MANEADWDKWFAAELVLEITVENDPRIVSQIETYLIRADSPDAAYSRALELGPSLDYRYRNSDGEIVTMKYRGIHALDSIQDTPKDGTQITVRQSLMDNKAAIDDMIRSKNRLDLFTDSDDGWDGPNLSQ